MVLDLVFVVAGYLIGSVSAAIVVCRAMGLTDPRTEGSRNPGATNVLRIGGKKPAALTLAGDFLKGLVPVLLAAALGASELGIAATGLAAFLGHLFPVFFGFEGGKGVATALGVFLALSWQMALACLGTWLLVAAAFRISSLAALTAAALAPVFAWWLALPGAYLPVLVVMVALLFWRHRENIQRLIAGTESRIGKKG